MFTLYAQSLTPNEGDEIIEKFIETYKWYKDFFVTREPTNKIMSEEWFSQEKERILAKVNETFWSVVNYIKYGVGYRMRLRCNCKTVLQKMPDTNRITGIWGSVTQAANSLGVKQPNLSKAITDGRVYHGFVWIFA